MAHSIISGRPVWIDGYQFNNQLNKAAISYGADGKEATTLADGTHIMASGLKSAGLAIEGFFDVTAGNLSIDKKLFDQVSLADLPIMVAAQTGAVGQIAYFMNAVQGEYNPQGQIGELMKFTAVAGAAGELVRGTIEFNSETVGSSDASAGQQLGAVSASQTVYAALFVTNAGGSTPTLDVVVESDDNSSFTSATTRMTFAQKTDIGSELLSVAGAITDDYWRISYTIGGTSPDFDFAVAIGIQ